jgi:hypothetical protein
VPRWILVARFAEAKDAVFVNIPDGGDIEVVAWYIPECWKTLELIRDIHMVSPLEWG